MTKFPTADEGSIVTTARGVKYFASIGFTKMVRPSNSGFESCAYNIFSTNIRHGRTHATTAAALACTWPLSPTKRWTWSTMMSDFQVIKTLLLSSNIDAFDLQFLGMLRTWTRCTRMGTEQRPGATPTRRFSERTSILVTRIHNATLRLAISWTTPVVVSTHLLPAMTFAWEILLALCHISFILFANNVYKHMGLLKFSHSIMQQISSFNLCFSCIKYFTFTIRNKYFYCLTVIR